MTNLIGIAAILVAVGFLILGLAAIYRARTERSRDEFQEELADREHWQRTLDREQAKQAATAAAMSAAADSYEPAGMFENAIRAHAPSDREMLLDAVEFIDAYEFPAGRWRPEGWTESHVHHLDARIGARQQRAHVEEEIALIGPVPRE